MFILVIKTFFFFTVLLWILVTSSESLLPIKSLMFLFLIMPILAWNVPLLSLIFLKRSLVFPILLLFSISLYCSLRRPSHHFLLFSETLHSVGYILPFLPCFWLVIFPQLFVISPQTATLSSCISFSLEWFCSLSPVQCYENLSIVLQALSMRSNSLKLFVTFTI